MPASLKARSYVPESALLAALTADRNPLPTIDLPLTTSPFKAKLCYSGELYFCE